MRQDSSAQLADYRGVLRWDSFVTYDAGVQITRPTVEIPLYIKEHSIPSRKPKVTMISTVPTIDPNSQRDISTQAVFWGTPDLLTVTLSGWIITFTQNSQFNPTVDGSKDGAPLNVGNVSYGEVISAYLEGRMDENIVGAWQRRDPSVYISPHGHVYPHPVIAIWEPQYSPNMRKQPFNMTLYLEN